ncbi:MAG: hypothetical protein ACYSU6_10115 [Planctomycetota bacterium]|jgi:hypothetical protein
MKAKFNGILRTAFFLIAAASLAFGQTTEQKKSFAEYLTEGVPTKKDIDVFLNDISWAQFDPDVGYILSNYMPHDGMDGSSTISTVRPNGARTSFMYTNEPCRINTYGDSFTQCHQVSDGVSQSEILAWVALVFTRPTDECSGKKKQSTVQNTSFFIFGVTTTSEVYCDAATY